MTKFINVTTVNEKLRKKNPMVIVDWAISLNKKTIVTTNFGPYEAAILHIVTQLNSNIPIICVDHGYNTEATYRFAEKLVRRLRLNIHYYTPRISTKRREVIYGGIPSIDNQSAHDEFTREVKLEPFSRAIGDFLPEVWLTAIRKEQTSFRDSLDIVTQDTNTGIIKVAPLFYWTKVDLEKFLVENNLPIETDYNDPTKVFEKRECGLHLGCVGQDALC